MPDYNSCWEKLLSPKSLRTLKDNKKRGADTFEDPRTPFERDLGKVVFSTPFRRLQDKAQVFPLEPMDGIRNRRPKWPMSRGIWETWWPGS